MSEPQDNNVIASTSATENAHFINQGTISFSNFFWTHIFNGYNIRQAFDLAKEAISHVTAFQSPVMDISGKIPADEIYIISQKGLLLSKLDEDTFQDIVQGMETDDVAEILEMQADDAADLLRIMPEEMSDAILRLPQFCWLYDEIPSPGFQFLWRQPVFWVNSELQYPNYKQNYNIQIQYPNIQIFFMFDKNKE